MVVIQLDRPQTNLEAVIDASTGIFQKVAANLKKIERQKQLQEAIQREISAGRKVGKTFGKGGELSGFTAEIPAPAESGFIDFTGQKPTTGTRAVTVPSAQSSFAPVAPKPETRRPVTPPPLGEVINPGQALGRFPAPPQTLAQPQMTLAPQVDPLQGQLIPEKVTAKKGGQTLTLERRPLESELERTGERKAQESLRSAQLKDVEKRKVNLRSSKLKLGNSLRSFVDQARRTEKLTGAKPGPIGGFLSFILGKTKQNEFVRGFIGGLTEVAAAVGATAIPNARAVRLVSLFKGTGIGQFDTIESGVQTTADSIVNGMSGDMAAAPWEYVFGDLPTERQSKAKWDALTRNEQTEIVDKVLPVLLEKFEDDFVKESIDSLFDLDPQLLGTETIQRIESERLTERNTFSTPSGVSFTINTLPFQGQ